MSDSQHNPEPLSSSTSHSPLAIYACVETPSLAESLKKYLASDRYTPNWLQSSPSLHEAIASLNDRIDCLIVERSPNLLAELETLYASGILLPVVLLESELSNFERYTYHTAEVSHSVATLDRLSQAIDRAIAQFLTLAPPHPSLPPTPNPTLANSLLLQQRRLSEKLQERLGYLGLYYQRNPQDFWPNLSDDEQKAIFQALSAEYREILLGYFSEVSDINQTIDRFVTQAFFADLSISQVLEIHMELIDEFSQQLKLEGRSEEILLDYRLTLIDVIAHLCEMYRRSIPREDLLLAWYARD
ncbi:circadian clock protein KaiA [Oscillatoria sp. FACHB-1406]|uniref:circadian clock protein KaiA n=1 Tax=Oscillatoria sp. FACHB-1406 TaxID=2692846 RepID=UPI001689FD90|nr:circadian clock protein KaiA [Oscillatoria sp. FACHB-1406]MBD2578184.1 circadian clock protein KaiA [Oscillatoria sp. FACHB-1406]